MFRAAAALPHNDRERATSGLRGQLRLMAAAAGGTANWSTLDVAGPVTTPGRSATWFEWTASVTVVGVEDQADDDALDAALPIPRKSSIENTAPLAAAPPFEHTAPGTPRCVSQ
jgi:hypothetical protein